MTDFCCFTFLDSIEMAPLTGQQGDHRSHNMSPPSVSVAMNSSRGSDNRPD